ncbi:hypothetical protein DAH22_20120 [Escherichia coli]|nr:hypothetical protein DAH22_20120 [Escherichia coli]
MCIHLNLMIFTKIIRGFISTEYHFEQQDDRGVTSLTINKQTRKGSVTIFDVNGKVTHTGVLNNCH